MGQHRQALKARRRRQRSAYWTQMRPVIALLAEIIDIHLRVRKARFRRAARLMADYIKERLSPESFINMILPVITEPEAP